MISGGKLNIFNRNDLMIKTDFELSKIAKREELLNRYAMYNKKDVLIDKILEHLNKKYKYIISKLNEDKRSNISRYIKDNIVDLVYYENDIVFEEEFRIYLDIDNIVNKVFVSNDKRISTDLIILSNLENEIYAVGYLEYVSSSRDYKEYKICIRKDTNFIKEKIYDKLKIIFFEEGSDLRVFNIYDEINVNDLIHESIYTYSVFIDKYEIIKPKILDKLYINLGSKKVESIYRNEEFYILFVNYTKNIIYFGEDVKDYLINDNFKYREYEILNIKDVFNYFDEEIKCIDMNSNIFVLKGREIFSLFINSYISKIEADKLIKIKEIEYISDFCDKKLNSKYNKYFYVNLKYIDNNKKNSTYTLFYIDDNEFSFLDVSYTIKDSKVSYDLVLNVEKKYQSNIFNNDNIKKFLVYLIKFLITDNELNDIYYLDLINFREKINDLEYTYPIMYDKYVDNNYLYSKAKQNYKIFEYIAERVWHVYINSIHEQYIKLDDIYNFDNKSILIGKYISREVMDYLVKEFSKIHIDNFFKNYDTIDIIKKFINIKMSGELLKTKVIYDVLKEYIPGRYISNNTSSDKENLFKYLYKYDELQNKGEIKFDYIFKDIKYEFTLYSLNYKSEKEEVLKSNINKYGYIDKISETIYISFILEYEYEYMENNIKELKWYLIKEYTEMDENDFLEMSNIGIEKNYINEVVEGKVRIFVHYEENKLKFYQIKRINDQLYINFSESLI
jgi:hypothetical protein